ncbi:putative (R)-mandelonitrile lyase [Helianthus anomalus]
MKCTLATGYDSDSLAKKIVSKDGVQHRRTRILGGGSMINYGFYSRADDCFYNNAGIEWDMGVVACRDSLRVSRQ